MDDMNAFDRQLASVVFRRVGPSEPVDDAAIFTATQSSKWRFHSMFNATKFVVAGAIVALFGGFLLSSVLTTQPSEESLPAAVTDGPGTFSPVPSLAGDREGHSATLLTDGRVLVVGDTSSGLWDPRPETFTAVGPIGTPRLWHSAVRLADDRILIVGGVSPRDGEGETVSITSAEVWDPATETFSLAGSSSHTVAGPGYRLIITTLLLDGRVLVIGGGAQHANFARTSTEIWDPETESFSPAGEMAESRVGQTATLLTDGRVLVVGGEVSDTGPLSFGEEPTCEVCESPAALAEVWDPATGLFSPAGSLSEGRAEHTATLLPDGRVLVIGGGDTFDYETSSAEVWDPAAESFSPAGSLLEPRARHAATLLPDGRVLVIGGWNGSVVASAEVWDPATASFEPAGSLAGGGGNGYGATSATLLSDGRVLVPFDISKDPQVWSP